MKATATKTQLIKKITAPHKQNNKNNGNNSKGKDDTIINKGNDNKKNISTTRITIERETKNK